MKIYKRYFIWFVVLLALFYTQNHYAQTKTNVVVQGKITDTSNESIIGAVVKVLERPVGTISDIDGNFFIEAIVGETLEISYLGYTKKKIKVTSSETYLSIVLEEESIELGNVVVVGYGTTSKEKLTGAVSSVQCVNC